MQYSLILLNEYSQIMQDQKAKKLEAKITTENVLICSLKIWQSEDEYGQACSASFLHTVKVSNHFKCRGADAS